MGGMELLGPDMPDYFLRLIVAAAIGGIVGIERDIKGKPAGMRTNMLMCVGSCLVMILSVEVARDAGPPADPARIAAQVVTGVGFIGAGMILRSRVSVIGLTSAATVWFISAIGLVVGYGNYALAGVAATLTILTLSGLNRLEKRIEKSRQLHIVRMHITGPNLGRVRNVLVENRVTPDEIEVKRTDTGVAIDVEYVGLDRKHLALVHALKEINDVEILLHY
jgi:putative Mg2+ transporter-C (MgtC) family protein